jgi:hypothetical protein
MEIINGGVLEYELYLVAVARLFYVTVLLKNPVANLDLISGCSSASDNFHR